jgi:hypothetical protein
VFVKRHDIITAIQDIPVRRHIASANWTRLAGTGLINPQVVEMPRMRPAIEAGLMVLLEVADPYMRPVLHTCS